MFNQIQSYLEPWLIFLADDPSLRALQLGMLLLGVIVIFLVFFVTRDILLRTHSFFYMFICIVLVALLPIAGFFLYLLIRPPRTIKERELEELLQEVVREKEKKRPAPKKKPGAKRGGIVKKSSEDLSL